MNSPEAWELRMPSQPIYELEVALAVQAGEVDGDIYADGAIWANTESLERWMGTPKAADATTD